MFIVDDIKKILIDAHSSIFDFHFPDNPIVPGALSAALLHQIYYKQHESSYYDVNILFEQPIRQYDILTLHTRNEQLFYLIKIIKRRLSCILVKEIKSQK